MTDDMLLSRDEMMRETGRIADGMVRATIEPIDGCFQVWRLSTMTNQRYLSEVSSFVGVAAQWDEYPDFRDELITDGLLAARRFLEQFPYNGAGSRVTGS